MRSALLLGPLVVLALLLPAAAQAQSATEKEARRQLEFAKTEVGQHNYEKALASADSDLAAGPGMLPEAGEALDRLRTTEVAAGNATVGDPTVVTTALPDLQTSDLPRLPPGSESLTAWLILQQRLRAAEAQRNAGVALLAAGAGLAGLGGGMMAGAASASQTSPNDPNIESMHAAGLGALLSGAVVFAASLPLTIGSAAQAGKFKRDASNLTAAAPARPRLEAGASGLALRFP
jgi:hypothetical protein